MAAQGTEPRTRSVTPESTLTSSFYRATTTMDELTLALQNFSRLPSPSPEFPTTLVCCCRKEDCETSKSWSSLKSKLESRLILSAGALLLIHERFLPFTEYMRRGGTGFTSEARGVCATL
jgi:hypothetical protein